MKNIFRMEYFYSEDERNAIIKELEQERDENDEGVCDEDVSAIIEDYEFDDVSNLKFAPTLDGRIICIANLGLWSGRKSGYKILSNNLDSMVYDIDTTIFKLEYDGYNIVGTDIHHDGRNYYTFRELREDRNIDKFLDIILEGEPTNSQLNYYTKSLRKPIKEIYGW